MGFRRARDQVQELRAEIASESPARRLIVVSTKAEAGKVKRRLGPGDDALIVITGVPRTVSLAN